MMKDELYLSALHKVCWSGFYLADRAPIMARIGGNLLEPCWIWLSKSSEIVAGV